MEAFGQQFAGPGILEPVEQVAQDPEARGHQPARVARVHPFRQHLDLQHAAHHPAQIGRQPQLVVVACAAVEAHHQVDASQAALQCVDVGGQVVRAAFLAAFDQAQAPWSRDALRVERPDRGQRGVDRVAVVGASAAVQQAVLVLRRPGPEVVAPAGELGLLVEVAVHQHRPGIARASAGARRRRVEEDHRRATRQPHHLELQPGHGLPLDPLRRVADHALDVPVRLPFGVEHRALRGNGDVIDERRDDGFIPGAIAESGDRGRLVRGAAFGPVQGGFGSVHLGTPVRLR